MMLPDNYLDKVFDILRERRKVNPEAHEPRMFAVMEKNMNGRRVYPDKDGDLWLKEGDYGQDKNGVWLARPHGCNTGNLSRHEVTEHDDYTITVTPSILITGEKSWHGYLTRGVWRKV